MFGVQFIKLALFPIIILSDVQDFAYQIEVDSNMNLLVLAEWAGVRWPQQRKGQDYDMLLCVLTDDSRRGQNHRLLISIAYVKASASRTLARLARKCMHGQAIVSDVLITWAI